MVYFVGAGPGAKDLITVRGMKLLQCADIVIYAGSLVNTEVLDFCKPGCQIHDSSRLTLEEVIKIISDGEDSSKYIVRLHTGDPSLFGAVREQMDELDRLHIPYESCPGVSSLGGAAASLNLEYTLPGVSQKVIITRTPGKTPVPEGSTIVYFLSSSHGDKVERELRNEGFSLETPVAVVYKATWPDEKVLYCRLGDLEATLASSGISKTALIIAGDVVGKYNYDRSRLYSPDFETEYRKAKTYTKKQ
ncbi:MAG: precorrin-4 C(11)-methyltransferase [Lachnospiraceae bacterium]|nr:precorrin-4 C(11)-methyltransferase [Lachnospiraceae bacterium]